MYKIPQRISKKIREIEVNQLDTWKNHTQKSIAFPYNKKCHC